jgi:hypothetical protein
MVGIVGREVYVEAVSTTTAVIAITAIDNIASLLI